MIKFSCEKLSRDKTLETMKASNISTEHTIINNGPLLDALNKKLIEEALEVTQAKIKSEIISELADILEVIDALYKTHGINHEEVLEVKKTIKENRGGFEKGLYVKTIEMNDDNPWVQYFKKYPEKYPQIKI